MIAMLLIFRPVSSNNLIRSLLIDVSAYQGATLKQEQESCGKPVSEIVLWLSKGLNEIVNGVSDEVMAILRKWREAHTLGRLY